MTKPDNPPPLVTVYMPTYNRVELLKRAVESVLSQDYRNIELIVVDDNSTDGTHKYLAEIAEKDSRFRYFINEENSGACVSRNKAIFAAEGEFITGLDDDDYFMPNRISSFLDTWFLNEGKLLALYSHFYIKKNNGKLKKYNRIPSCSYNDLLISNWIGNQIFTKTSSLREIGGFDVNLPVWQDLECWYRLLKYKKYDAHLSDNHTYVVDISHEHERITKKNTTSIDIAFDYVCSKYDLPHNLRQILKLQHDPYVGDIPPISGLVRSIILKPRPYVIKVLFKLYTYSRIKKLFKLTNH